MARAKRRGHRFEKGNKFAVGNPGPQRPKVLTQALISQLNEVVKHGTLKKIPLVDAKGRPILYKAGPHTGQPKHRWAFDEATRTNIEHIISAMIGNAKDGDMTAIKEIFDRVEGKVIQAQEIDPNANVVNIRITRDDEEV